ncbi:hypothetical protein VULLAG_LOCUS4797 [Vulpes lagopus]
MPPNVCRAGMRGSATPGSPASSDCPVPKASGPRPRPWSSSSAGDARPDWKGPQAAPGGGKPRRPGPGACSQLSLRLGPFDLEGLGQEINLAGPMSSSAPEGGGGIPAAPWICCGIYGGSTRVCSRSAPLPLTRDKLPPLGTWEPKLHLARGLVIPITHGSATEKDCH